MYKTAVAVLLVFALSACNTTLVVKDETQEANLTQLNESWDTLEVEYFAKGDVPPDFVRDSHEDLLEEALELEQSKKESWEDQAREAGWGEPATEE